MSDLAQDAGRLLIGGFFLVAGIANVFMKGSIEDHIVRMRQFGMPLAAPAFWLGIVLQLGGAVLVVTNLHVKAGAWALIVFTSAATLIFHRFWQKTDPMQRKMSRLTLLSNCAIVGGLVLLLRP